MTGTKGKSTTASLIAHMLRKLGRRVALVGNIGVPITEIDPTAADYAVIEVSSYQAADFDGVCDVAVLTSLFPEHLDWHRTLDAYYRDKINLLRHSRRAIVNRDAAAIAGSGRYRPTSFCSMTKTPSTGAAPTFSRVSSGSVGCATATWPERTISPIYARR